MIEQLLEADRQLQVDQVARAREIYARVLELDPTNAMAAVGLAECALADGDDEEAYALASKALTIDPENDKARRMEARLSEVLTMRGATVERPAAADTPAAHEMRPVVTASEAASAGADAATSTPEPDPRPATAGTDSQPASTRNPMRKSLFDRLLGR